MESLRHFFRSRYFSDHKFNSHLYAHYNQLSLFSKIFIGEIKFHIVYDFIQVFMRYVKSERDLSMKEYILHSSF